tara:strand:+ start:789 stop:980 length:192 start_codon:yes stop_codon:yes gene_type:complete
MNIDFEQETWRLADVHCDGQHPGETNPWFDDWSTLDQFMLMCDFVAFISKYKYSILLDKRRGL